MCRVEWASRSSFNATPDLGPPTLPSVADQAPPTIVVLVAKGGAAAFNASLSGERAGRDSVVHGAGIGAGVGMTEQGSRARCGVACSTRGA